MAERGVEGTCPGCINTFKKLDEVLKAAAAYEVESTGIDMRAARLHVLAAVCSWWLDRTIKSFLGKAEGIEKALLCLRHVKAEQGIRE